jgi:hypothetical protein
MLLNMANPQKKKRQFPQQKETRNIKQSLAAAVLVEPETILAREQKPQGVRHATAT